jgi:hypothetical protein
MVFNLCIGLSDKLSEKYEIGKRSRDMIARMQKCHPPPQAPCGLPAVAGYRLK